MKKFFVFSRMEKAGILFWTVAIVVVFIVLQIDFKTNHHNPFVVSEKDMQYVQLNASKNTFDSAEPENNFEKNGRPQLFIFDPNTISKSEWKKLGFSDKQADAIINYKNSKGPFKVKSDLKKVFVISDEKYQELEPYISIQENFKTEEKEVIKISLNSATSDELEALPTIGEKFAERIIKYRKSLGGFSSITQLHEIYNMSEETYQILVESTVVNQNEIKKINLNTASKEEIDKHPYITWPMTAEILKRRDQEKISGLDFLIEKGAMTSEEKEKIEPYIEY